MAMEYMVMDNVTDEVRLFILNNLVPDESSVDIRNDTDLREIGLLDSLSTLRLMSFLEEKFHIDFEAADLDEDSFSSLLSIERLVETKLAPSRTL